MRIIYALLLIGSMQAIIAGTVGNPLLTGEATDTASGYLYAYDGTFGAAGNLLTWSFDAGSTNPNWNVTGHSITPVIWNPTAPGGWTITGIGATETISGPGVYTFSFDLVSGSNMVGPNFTFGWYDGSATAPNSGTISFNRATTSVGFRDFGSSGFPLLGNTYVMRSNFTGANDGTSWTGGRVYSVQFDLSSDAPEPSSLAMIVGGALMIIAVRRRR